MLGTDAEHADELSLSIGEDDDRWLIVRDDVLNNVRMMTYTHNGDNHFTKRRRGGASRRVKRHMAMTGHAQLHVYENRQNTCLA